jgi:hypothetical protein
MTSAGQVTPVQLVWQTGQHSLGGTTSSSKSPQIGLRHDTAEQSTPHSTSWSSWKNLALQPPQKSDTHVALGKPAHVATLHGSTKQLTGSWPSGQVLQEGQQIPRSGSAGITR